jgi:general secretion pathway protein K
MPLGQLLQTMQTWTITRLISRQRQSGIALVLVLWMLALLSAIAGSLVFSSRAELMIAANLASHARAEAFADAGVHKAVYELVTRSPMDPLRWKGDGFTHQWQFGGATLQVTILDESAKIDINSAPINLLQSLFQSQGLAEQEANALAAAVIDWRDADDLVTPNGAEKDAYAAAGRDYGPANAPFETIDELRLVLGMTDDLFRRLESSVTVYSQQAGVNSTVAQRNVLLSFPGATPELVDTYIEQRRQALEQGVLPLPFPLGQGLTANATGSTFSIQVLADLGDNTRFFREAVVRPLGSPSEPITFLAWRAPAPPLNSTGITQGGNTP